MTKAIGSLFLPGMILWLLADTWDEVGLASVVCFNEVYIVVGLSTMLGQLVLAKVKLCAPLGRDSHLLSVNSTRVCVGNVVRALENIKCQNHNYFLQYARPTDIVRGFVLRRDIFFNLFHNTDYP